MKASTFMMLQVAAYTVVFTLTGSQLAAIFAFTILVIELAIIRIKSAFVDELDKNSDDIARMTEMKNLCFELYQINGQLGANEKVLDNLIAAFEGFPLPHKTLLPYEADDE